MESGQTRIGERVHRAPEVMSLLEEENKQTKKQPKNPPELMYLGIWDIYQWA